MFYTRKIYSVPDHIIKGIGRKVYGYFFVKNKSRSRANFLFRVFSSRFRKQNICSTATEYLRKPPYPSNLFSYLNLHYCWLYCILTRGFCQAKIFYNAQFCNLVNMGNIYDNFCNMASGNYSVDNHNRNLSGENSIKKYERRKKRSQFNKFKGACYAEIVA